MSSKRNPPADKNSPSAARDSPESPAASPIQAPRLPSPVSSPREALNDVLEGRLKMWLLTGPKQVKLRPLCSWICYLPVSQLGVKPFVFKSGLDYPAVLAMLHEKIMNLEEKDGLTPELLDSLLVHKIRTLAAFVVWKSEKNEETIFLYAHELLSRAQAATILRDSVRTAQKATALSLSADR